jgi:hypothetical protein
MIEKMPFPGQYERNGKLELFITFTRRGYAKVFRSDFSEVSTQTSTVSLPPGEAAEFFRVLLDFVYNGIIQCDCRLSSFCSSDSLSGQLI